MLLGLTRRPGRITQKNNFLDLVRYHASTFPAGFDDIAQELPQYLFEWLSSCHQRFLGDAVQLRSFGGNFEALRGHVEFLGGDFLIHSSDRVSELYDPLEAYLCVVDAGVEAELPDVVLIVLVLIPVVCFLRAS